MTFTDLESHHYPLIARHYVETYNAPPWNDRWTEPRAAEKLAEMMDCRGAWGLVCHDGDGSFAGVALGSPETFYDRKQFFIKDFFVPLALQGRGIGTLLMAALEKRLAARGIDEIYLFTSKGGAAEAFYTAKGFKTWDGMTLMGKGF